MTHIKCPRCPDGVCESGKSACSFCLDKVKRRSKARRDRLRKAGLCYRCGKKKANAGGACSSCTATTNRQNARSNQKLKLTVFEAYGGPRCVCCNETHVEFLTIDHKNGGGNDHRRELFGAAPGTGRVFYRWLRDNGYPPGYQVLCFNCNIAKHMFGACPHTRLRKV